jgi:hypothetical protein
MRFLRACGVVVASLVLAAACGGANSTGLAGGDDGGSDAGDGATAKDGASDALADSAAEGAADATGDAPGDVQGGDAPNDVTNAACPDESGAYSVAVVAGQGQGCGDLNTNAPECIVQTGCNVVFRSNVPGGTPAINGDPALQTDGSFSGGALKEGTGNRTGCTGTWDVSASTLTVDCGGLSSTQACEVTLTRTATKCP